MPKKYRTSVFLNFPYDEQFRDLFLGGTDVYAHGGSAEGILREISNAFMMSKRRRSVGQMLEILGQVRSGLEDIMLSAKAETPYSAGVFSGLILLTNEIVK